MAKRADFLVNAETKGMDKIKDMSVSVKDLERAQNAAAKATRNIRAELKESAITAGAFKNAFDGLDNSLRMMQGVLSDPRRLMQEATKGMDFEQPTKRTEEKATAQKWYETTFARIGQGLCAAALMWLLFLYLKRKF